MTSFKKYAVLVFVSGCIYSTAIFAENIAQHGTTPGVAEGALPPDQTPPIILNNMNPPPASAPAPAAPGTNTNQNLMAPQAENNKANTISSNDPLLLVQ